MFVYLLQVTNLKKGKTLRQLLSSVWEDKKSKLINLIAH